METPPAEIAPETIQALIARAAASGLSVNDYLRQLLGINNEAPPAPDGSLDEFMADLEALAEGTEHLPPSTLTYSREDIYFDHD
jgi:hypothetical protein